MISVTSKSRYAVVALAELAKSGDHPVPVKELADRRGVPDQFLEQLFSTLRRAGFLTSHRGSKGGYTLARSPEEITVLEVVHRAGGRRGRRYLGRGSRGIAGGIRSDDHFGNRRTGIL
jgi:Rrf2 family protein